MKSIFRRLFLHSRLRYIIAIGIIGLVMLLYWALRGYSSMLDYANALGVGSALAFGVGALSMVAFLGGFNTFSYGFSTLGRKTDRKYEDLYDYTIKKKERQQKQEWTFIPYMVVGLLGIIISFIL